MARGKDDTLYALKPGHVSFRGRHIDIIPSDADTPVYEAVSKAG